jgi:chromatin structure-remodeling complex protein RSC7
MQYPSIMQPTHARWEQLPSPSPTLGPRTDARADVTTTNEALTNGTATLSIDDADNHDPPSIFPTAAPVYTRNFMIADTYFTSPSLSNLGVPGPDGDEWDVGPKGLTDIPEDVLSLLPPECLGSFLEAREEERKWKESWYGEAMDGARGRLRVGF